MGSTLKGNDVLTLRTDTNGLLNNMVVTADANGGVKGIYQIQLLMSL